MNTLPEELLIKIIEESKVNIMIIREVCTKWKSLEINNKPHTDIDDVYNNIDMLKYCLSKSHNIDKTSVCCRLIRLDKYDVLIYVKSGIKYKFTIGAEVKYAIKYNRYNILQYLLITERIIDRYSVKISLYEMLVYNRLDMILLLIGVTPDEIYFNTIMFKYMVRSGNVDIFRFVFDNIYRKNYKSILLVNYDNYLEFLVWEQSRTDIDYCDIAISNGHLDMLIFLYNNGCKLTEEHLQHAKQLQYELIANWISVTINLKTKD